MSKSPKRERIYSLLDKKSQGSSHYYQEQERSTKRKQPELPPETKDETGSNERQYKNMVTGETTSFVKEIKKNCERKQQYKKITV